MESTPVEVRSPGPADAPVERLKKSVKGSDVVAAGATPQFLQLPSPVYLVEWVSPTHVLIGAGGGGSRFGMVNVLVMLSIHTEQTSGHPAANRNAASLPPASSTASALKTVKLTADQQKAVQAAPSRKDRGGAADDAGDQLWHFVAALDLGGDVPWCSSRFLPWNADSAASDDDEDDTEAVSKKRKSHFVFSAAQRATLSNAVGLIVLSSVKNFTLVSVERHRSRHHNATSAGGGSEEEEGSLFSLRMLARVVIPNDHVNPDKKPVALVHNAVVVAHDGKGVLLYDLTDLVPEGAVPQEQQSDMATESVITSAKPLAEWSLPARVNDLHANRVNLTQVKPSPRTTKESASDGAKPKAMAVKALLLDFVVVVVAVQDKTVRLASFRLRRDYGPEPVQAREHQIGEGEKDGEGAADAPAPAPTTATARKPAPVKIDDPVSAPFSLLPGNVFAAEDFGLSFKPLASSFRLVRLFGLEDLTEWSGAVESARRRAANASLSQVGRPSPASTGGGGGGVTPELPVLSLLLVAFDAQGGQSHFVALMLNTALALRESVPWRWDGPAAPPESLPEHAVSELPTAPSRGKSQRKRSCQQPIAVFSPSAYAGPSAVVKDCVTCISAARGDTKAVACSEAIRRNPFGAAIPADWIAGTVDGWVVRVVTQEAGPRTAAAANSVPTTTRKTETQPELVFVAAQTRPLTTPAYLKKRYPLLHKEPVTAVAVSHENDVLSTDLAQNVAISTLPFTLVPAKGLPGVAAASSKQHGQPAVMKQKRPGLQLFPPVGGGAGELLQVLDGPAGKAIKLGLAIVGGSLLLLVLILYLVITL